MNAKKPEAPSEIALALQAISANVQALSEKQDQSGADKEVRERASLAALIATAFFTFLTLLIFARQLREMEKVYEPISKQSTTAFKQTEILEKQSKVQQGQLEISEQQTTLIKLQYLPSFSIGVNGSVTDTRVVDILNGGAAVDNFYPQMFSTLRVDFWLPANNRRETSYFGLIRGYRNFGPLQRELAAQMKSTMSQPLIERVQRLAHQNLRPANERARWRIERIVEADWVFLEYNTRDDYKNHRNDVLMTDPTTRVAYASVAVRKAFLEASYYNTEINGDLEIGTSTKLADFLTFPDLVFGQDIDRAAQFLYEYLVRSRDCLNFEMIRSSGETSSAISDMIAASNGNSEIREPVSKLIQPSNCKKLAPTIKINPPDHKQSWEWPG